MCGSNGNKHTLDTMRLNGLWTVVDMNNRLKEWLKCIRMKRLLIIFNNDWVMRILLLQIVLLHLYTTTNEEWDVPESIWTNDGANNRIRLVYATVEVSLLLRIGGLIIIVLITLRGVSFRFDKCIKVTGIEWSWKEGMSTWWLKGFCETEAIIIQLNSFTW